MPSLCVLGSTFVPCLSNIGAPPSTSRHVLQHYPSIASLHAPRNSLSPSLDPSPAPHDPWLCLPQLGARTALACSLTTLLCLGNMPCLEDSQFRGFVENFFGVGVAHAGLVQMPPANLNNRYYLVRSGESEFEKMGIINTNPVTKTNIDSGLSDSGKKQTLKAAIQLKEMGACEGSCWIWPSITQRAYQSAETIAYVNNVNRR